MLNSVKYKEVVWGLKNVYCSRHMEVTRDPRSVLVDYEARTRLEWIEE